MNNSMKKKLNAALFKAVRDEDGPGTVKALQDGADPSAVSRERTPMERAMLHFPNRWSEGVVGALIAATGKPPVVKPDAATLARYPHLLDELEYYARKVLIEGLARKGQAEALGVVLGTVSVYGRSDDVERIRYVLCEAGQGDRHVAEVAFASKSDAEAAVGPNKATWLHQVVCGGRATEVGVWIASYPHSAPWYRGLDQRRIANLQVLEHLLSLHADVDVRWLGMTPLHLAAFQGDEGALKALLAAGADPDLPDGNNCMIGNGYGYITPDQLALVENYRLQRELQRGLPGAASGQRSRL